MALASDLMGLGVPALQALRTATGGNGPLTITAAGSAFASATRIGSAQFLVSCTNADGTKALSLPAVGTDNGCLLADDFIINNAGTTSLQIFASSGVQISVGTTNSSATVIQAHTTMTLYPVSSTQWIGVKGA